MGRIRRDDTVTVMAGKDKGKTGKVLKVFPSTNRALVEGVNMAKKHTRQTRNDQQGGIVERECTINMSNLQISCKGCNRPVKTGYSTLASGEKVRFCKKCNETIASS